MRAGRRVVVIGAGMSGVLCGIELARAGLHDYVIYEKAARLGGTWRDNTYPGLACDVPSHVYSYSFEPNPDWSHRFAPGPEIQRYLEHTARKHGVLDHIEFDSEITRCEWIDGRWHVETLDGRTDLADFVITAVGVLHHPSLPPIDGMEKFEGALFHSARWDHGVDHRGRRLGVIGNGSTGVQIVSEVVDQVGSLTLFQRTPQWILPGANQPYSDEERARMRADPAALASLRAELTASFSNAFSNAVIGAESDGMRGIEAVCLQNLEQSVGDAALRERLRPDYRAACKRLIVADGFYAAIQRPNARLVSEAIEGFESRGVRTRDGQLHELDVIVLATGFEAHRFMRPMAVIGRDGRTIDEAWSPAPRAYRSVSLPDFPNFFMMVGPHSPIGNFSLIEISELQIGFILQLIEQVRGGACREISASRTATDRFNASIRAAMKGTIWVTGCQSWYLDSEGVPATWPWSVQRYRDEMQRPDFADFERLPTDRGIADIKRPG